MKETADNKGVSCEISAYSMSEFEEQVKNHDVCLVAPQAKYRFDEFKEKCLSLGKACELIDYYLEYNL